MTEEPQVEEPTVQETVQKARQVIERERQARMQRCMAQIQSVLDEHGMELAAVPGVTPDGRIAASVVLREKVASP